MKILILGLNYAPEPIGIGPYTAGMAAALAADGHAVTVVCGKPYYPAWKVAPGYEGRGVQTSREAGVRVVRLPIYVPAIPGGGRRLLHHASFAACATPFMLIEARRSRPDIVIGIAPSLIACLAARLAAFLFAARLWLHVQDFEVEAAFATGLLKDRGLLARTAIRFERWSLKADRISTISPQMCAKLVGRGLPADRVVEFRNWAEIDRIRPIVAASPYRAAWAIDRPYVVLYSGNVANKQGIEIIVAAARLLADRHDLMFVICGQGPNLDLLKQAAQGMANLRFHDLQPMDRLSDLLGLATLHLLPQIAGAADLVLPSKLANMLASGRPVIACAPRDTGLADEVEGVGLVVDPENVEDFAAAIVQLLDDAPLRTALGQAARDRAERRWSKTGILDRFIQSLTSLVGSPARAGGNAEREEAQTQTV